MEGSVLPVLPQNVISHPEGMSYIECVLSGILGSREEEMVTC